MKKIIVGTCLALLSAVVLNGANAVSNGDFLQGQYKWNLQCKKLIETEFAEEQLTLKRLKKGYARVFQDIRLTPGKYKFSYLAKVGNRNTVVSMWLIFKNKNNKYEEKRHIYLLAYYSDGKMKKISKDIDVPQNIIGARLCISIRGANASAVVDDVKIEKQP